MNSIYLDLDSMGIDDVGIIGVGKDIYNSNLDAMVDGRILPWVADVQAEGFPVWTGWGASQRDVFFLNREGILDTTFNITPYDPDDPENYVYILNLILDLRNEAVVHIQETSKLPNKFVIRQNYPNPFNPVTTLRYDLPEQSMVNIIIYDLLGREVRTLVNQTQDAGFRSVIWNATNDYGKPVSAGVYLY
ncbi:MAG: FlgD immunoglobulin-like domain containing protein, partial [Candidatus Marinimicrobia bacterium]|nr:FlgD immunoglobulin-like domain containing protein [Candidatus Neomarinimicrobiota bacterium]